MKKKTGYRLLWFQHMHKSAGTSIVKMAERNGEKLYPSNDNGNPQEDNGKIKELWKYPDWKLAMFIDACEELGVTFVATEWGAPDFEFLKKDKRVVTFTCLREPIDRYISNYWFDFYFGFTKCKSLMDYNGSRGLWTMDNYYCRILSGIENRNHSLDITDYEKAYHNLCQLDYYFALENDKDFSQFVSEIGWKYSTLHENKTGSFLRQSLSNIKNARFGLVWRRIRNWRRNPDVIFLSRLKIENKWDINLYDYVFYNPNMLLSRK